MKGLYTLLMGLLLVLSIQQLAGQNQTSVTIESASAPVGQQVCLSITGDNFDGILGFQFSLDYDPAVLQFESSTGAVFFSQSVFIQNNSTDGSIRVIWNIFSNDELTNSEPFSLGEICFTVLQEIEADVTITNSPIPIDFSGLNGRVTDLTLVNGVVNGGVGGTPTCTDGIQNGTETGVDCGGSCPPCTAGPTCTDGIQNGTETGVDCGGSCTPCPINTDDLVFSLGSTTGAVGTQVCMDVTTQNFSTIGAFQFSMAYNPAVLTYVSATNLAFNDINVVQPAGSPGQIRVSWVYFQPDNIGGNLADGSRVFTLCFNVLQTTSTTVSFGSTPIGIEAFNTSNVPLDVVTSNGTVNGSTMPTCTDGIRNGTETGVDCGGSCPPCTAGPTCTDGIQNGTETGVDCGGSCPPCMPQQECTVNGNNLTLCLSDECATVGQQACVDIEVSNFTDVTGMEFRVNYAAGNLNYVSRTNNPIFLGGVSVTEPMPGQLVAIWFDQSNEFQGVDLADGSVAITFCFEAENQLSTPINLSLVNFTNPDGENILPVDINPGSINASACGGAVPTCTDGIRNGNETGVDCGGSCAPCNPTGNDNCGVGSNQLFFCAENACGDVGSQVCFDINTTNFTSIVGFEFRVIYPGANLQYVSGTGSSSLPGSGPIFNPVSDGQLRVLWFDQTSQFNGGTIAVGQSLVNLCFTVETAATSSITITQQSASSTTNSSIAPINVTPGSVNAPACSNVTETCTDGIMNNGETGIDCGGPNCTACPVEATCGEGSSALFFCAENACGDVGSQVCFDINTTNFTSIVGFEFRVIYPGANLQYVSATGSSALPGAGPIINPASDGELRILWFDQTSQFNGGTIAAGESVINLCFNVETASTSTIMLTQQSASNVSGTVGNVQVTAGSVNAPACNDEPPSCTDGIRNNGETGIDCGGPNCAPCETCTDGIMNNGETGIDCGGPNCAPCPGNGQGNLTLNTSNGSGVIGQQTCLDVTVADFIAIRSLNLTMTYNPALLQVSSITASPNLPGLNSSSFTSPVPGMLDVDWMSTIPRSLNNNAVLFRVCFTIVGEGTSTVGFTSNSSITDGTNMPFGVVSNPGTVTGTNDFENLTFIMGSGIGAENAEVCLEMPVFNFTSVTSFSFTINYDPNKVTFNQIVANSNFPPGGGFQVTNPIPGEVRVLWLYNPPDFAGITAPDGTIILSACFTVVEACETAIEITGTPTNIVATDNQGETLLVDVISGTINDNVSCGSCEPENLVLEMSNATGSMGTEICLDIDVENFNGLTDLQFTLNYDPAVLQYQAVNNFGLGSISLSNFTIGPAGRIVFDWSSPNNDGQSLVDGTAVFSVCFIILDVEETQVTFTSTPVPILAQNGCGANVGVVPMNGVVNAGAPMGDDLTLQVLCQEAAINDEVCVPIQTFNFNTITGFQFSINYSPSLLDFVGLAPSPALNLQVNETTPGQIRVLWDSPGGSGQSIASGLNLMELCFNVLSTDPASIVFSNTPQLIEFRDEVGLVTPRLINCAINSNGGPQIDAVSITQPTCHDAADGRIELTVSGSTNLAYNWNPNPGMSTGPVLTNVSAGQTYTVEVIDLNSGESVTRMIFIPNQTPFTPQITSVQGVTCFGERDGSITIIPAGGMGPYIYDWSGNLQDNIPEQTGLGGGTYGVTVSDANGCSRVFDNIQVASAAEIDINALVVGISEQPGSITVGILNAALPSACSWTGPQGFTSTSCSLNSLTVPGTYCLTVLDNNGCTAVECFTLPLNLRITEGDINEGCENLNNGSIDLSVIGGLGTYLYSWTGPGGYTATTQDITGLSPGVYVVTVTSGVDMVTGSFTVSEPAGIIVAASITTADMGSNGAVNITPSGGTPPFTYLWSNGATTQDISMLGAGQYCVTVTDSRSCTRSSCYTVEAIPISGVVFDTDNVSCIGATDGSARIVISNGVAPFVASTTPGGFTASSTSDTISLTLPAGTFSVTVTDDQGGTFNVPVTIGSPSAIFVGDTLVVSDTEDAQCTGSITLMIGGGAGDYTVTWNLPSLSGPQVTGLCAGEYTATITDANGCTSEVIQVVIGQLNESAVATEVQCEGDDSGTINLTVDGGVTPYTFAWRIAGSTTVFATTEDVSGLTNGEYVVTIMDATGATLVRTYEVETAIGFSFTTTVLSNFNGVNISCIGATDGSARINVSGTGVYTYEWFLNENLVSTEQVLTNAGPGTYTVSVLSDAGCEQFGEVVLVGPTALALQSSQTNVSCVNERDGVLSVQVTGGVAPYNYAWSNGSTLPQAQFLRAGDYSVIVTDANGCTISREFTISEPEVLVVTSEATDADDGCNGTITILPLGGAENYNYRWPQLATQGNNPVARGLCPGVYEVEIFDNNNCQTVTVTIEVRDRRFPCLSERNVITPNGDGLNEAFILFCTDGSEASDNSLEIYNRWGQLVYRVNDYSCSDDGGLDCFEGRTNDGSILPEGPYYYVLDYFNPLGERRQKRGSITIVLE